MLNHPTHDQLHQLRLFGMARALTEQQALPDIARLSFEERLGLLVEREVSERHPYKPPAACGEPSSSRPQWPKTWTTAPRAAWIAACSAGC